jgi:RNA polymerase sigma-70 factor (ECF subfamily)
MTADAAPPTDPDRDLMDRAGAGEFEAFAELAGRYQNRLFGMARRITGSPQDAEDVVQQTLLAVIENLDSFRGDSTVAAWLLRIAANTALKVLRKRHGLPTVPTGAADGADDADSPRGLPHPEFIAPWRDRPDRLAESAELRAVLDEELAGLDERHRVVFVLRDVEGLSIRQTAETIGISEANVKVRLLRARLRLRERLTRRLGDEARRMVPDHSHG